MKSIGSSDAPWRRLEPLGLGLRLIFICHSRMCGRCGRVIRDIALIELRLREAPRKGSLHAGTALGALCAHSTNLKRAVLVAEDSGFWQHEGIDFEQMKESMEVNIERLEFRAGAARSRSNSPRTCTCRHRRIRSGRSARF